MNRNLPDYLVRRIEELIDASFSGRDELVAAARTMDDDKRRNVCGQLADHLADHAIELQQLLRANGENAVDPLDTHALAESYFVVIKNRGGESAVLSVAEQCERAVKEQFDQVIEETKDDQDTAAMLQRQRKDIEFGEHVLRSMREPPDEAQPQE